LEEACLHRPSHRHLPGGCTCPPLLFRSIPPRATSHHHHICPPPTPFSTPASSPAYAAPWPHAVGFHSWLLPSPSSLRIRNNSTSARTNLRCRTRCSPSIARAAPPPCSAFRWRLGARVTPRPRCCPSCASAPSKCSTLAVPSRALGSWRGLASPPPPAARRPHTHTPAIVATHAKGWSWRAYSECLAARLC
jgi:hypothetical protein